MRILFCTIFYLFLTSCHAQLKTQSHNNNVVSEDTCRVKLQQLADRMIGYVKKPDYATKPNESNHIRALFLNRKCWNGIQKEDFPVFFGMKIDYGKNYQYYCIKGDCDMSRISESGWIYLLFDDQGNWMDYGFIFTQKDEESFPKIENHHGY